MARELDGWRAVLCVAGLAAGLLQGNLWGQSESKKSGNLPVLPAPQTIIRHADPARAEQLIQEKKVLVLDIRTPKEYAAGHLMGAKNLDFRAADFEAQLSGLDKTTNYLVHCASGGRSTQSLEVFKKLQFRSLVHLDGGIQAWEKAGKMVVKP